MPIHLALRIAPVALAAALVVPTLRRAAPAGEQVRAPVPAVAVVRDYGALDAIVAGGIDAGVYPGAVVVTGRRDSVLYARGYGHLTWDASSPVPSVDSTLWDIASLTKVVGTASAALRLVDRGALELDAPVRRYLPDFTGPRKDHVTVGMLLNHTSGLRSYAQFFRLTRSRDEAIAMLLREPVRRAPGDSAVYSDLNAILLGLVLERAAGGPLDEVVAREVTGPLGLEQTLFRPPRATHRRAAPTGVFRGTPLRGGVNDPNADHLGGVAGHAGLFSTGADLARFAQAWLAEGDVPGARWVRAESVRRFLAPLPGSGTRRLGWDTRDTTLAEQGETSVFGHLMSRSAYGHTGWTGTAIWIDPERDLFLVFLTNRSFAPRSAESMRELRGIRAQLSDATVRLVDPAAACELLAAAPPGPPRC